MRKVLLGCLLLFSIAGCKRTEILIGAITDLNAPNVIDRIHLQAFVGGQKTPDQKPEIDQTWIVPGIGAGPFVLPGSYGIYSPDGNAVKVEIVLTGLKGDRMRVERRSVVSLVNQRTLFMRMGLVVNCQDMFDCPDGTTCIEGACKDKNVDSRRLPDYVDQLVDTIECGSAGFVNTGTGAAVPMMADAQSCDGDCVEGTCLHKLPANESDGGVTASPWMKQVTPTTSSIKAIWGTTANGYDVFAVGGGGTLLHLSGAGTQNAVAWVSESISGGPDFTGVFGSGPTDVWAVASSGQIFHRDATGWHEVTGAAPSGVALHAVAALAPSMAVAVGERAGVGVVLGWDGSSWTLDDTFPTGAPPLNAVWAIDAQDLVVAGDANGEFVHQSTGWVPLLVPDGVNVSFRGVWGSGQGGGWGVGTGGQIFRAMNNNSLTPEPSGVTTDLNAIWGSSPQDVYVVGNGGVILHSLGDGVWVRQLNDDPSDLLGVWAGGPNDVYVAGSSGTVLHSVGGTPTTCGNPGQTCCPPSAPACVGGFGCEVMSSTCQPCGGAGQPCCGDAQASCGAGLSCIGNMCEAPTDMGIPPDFSIIPVGATGQWTGSYTPNGGSPVALSMDLFD